MNCKRGTTILLIALLAISFSIVPAVAQDSHDDFDDADTDLGALLMSLNRTQELIHDSLNATLRVNYTQDIGDRVHQSYNMTEANDSLSSAYDSKATTAGTKRIIKDMPDDVPSSLYIEELYLPFYHVSSNLTSFTKNHKGLIMNLSDTGEHYNLYKSGEGEQPGTHLLSGLRSLNDASRNLNKMEMNIPALEKGVESINGTYFDTSSLRETLNETGELIPYYQGVIEELISLFEELAGYVTIYLPDSVHPGEKVDIEGYYSYNGSFVPNVTVIIKVGNDTIYEGETDEDGYYNETIQIPWNATGPITINASVPGDKTYSSNSTVITDMYTTDIDIDLSSNYYYDEEIKVRGNFTTDAPTNMENFVLDGTSGKRISPSEDGSFKLVYDSSDFRWGTGEIMVMYQGNDSISSSSDEVEFEVSIPTNISLEAESMEELTDISVDLTLYGDLINTSSDQGIEDEKVSLTVDEETFNSTHTGQDGGYEFIMDIEEAEVSEGLHTFYSSHNGTEKYRGCTSRVLYLYVEEGEYIVSDDLLYIETVIDEDLSGDGVIGPGGDDGEDGTDGGGEDEDGENDEPNPLVSMIKKNLLLLLIGLFLLLALLYYRYRTEKEDEDKGPRVPEKEKTPAILQRKKKKAPTASGWKDIPSSYADLLEVIDSKGIVKVSKGKTHREVYEDLKGRLDDRTQIQKITDMFEKVYFAGEELTENDVEGYNNAMNSLWGDLAV